jgi:PTS system nitrogen regulatory IIA component
MIQLHEQCIILELEATNKEAVLLELAASVHRSCPSIGIETINSILTEREQLGSTGVGNGVAIPHGKIPGLEQSLLCFGRSRVGVVFESMDRRPVHLFVLILSPVNLAEDYLKTLAGVSRLLKTEDTRQKLMQADSPQAIIELFTIK